MLQAGRFSWGSVPHSPAAQQPRRPLPPSWQPPTFVCSAAAGEYKGIVGGTLRTTRARCSNRLISSGSPAWLEPTRAAAMRSDSVAGRAALQRPRCRRNLQVMTWGTWRCVGSSVLSDPFRRGSRAAVWKRVVRSLPTSTAVTAAADVSAGTDEGGRGREMR